jgi:hypothetical protein
MFRYLYSFNVLCTKSHIVLKLKYVFLVMTTLQEAIAQLYVPLKNGVFSESMYPDEFLPNRHTSRLLGNYKSTRRNTVLLTSRDLKNQADDSV